MNSYGEKERQRYKGASLKQTVAQGLMMLLTLQSVLKNIPIPRRQRSGNQFLKNTICFRSWPLSETGMPKTFAHKTDSVEYAQEYLMSDLFNKSVVPSLSTYLKVRPISKYTV